LPIAVGHALRVGSGNAVAAFFGDGAVQTGVFHESMNLAALWRAPVLFVCENNGWAEFSSREEHTTVAEVARYGDLYGIAARTVDGTDVEAVAEAANGLLEGVRTGEGPALLECQFTRLRPHYEGDWRQHEAQEDMDALVKLERRLSDLGADPGELAGAREAGLNEARGALRAALAGAPPRPEDDSGLVFARPLP
jgi:TPP-dependent pyruvate/acetoin dehydrogenase alpha subunit